MIVTKNITFKRLMQFTGHHIPWLTAWMSLVVFLHNYFDLKWLAIPWLPVSLIGTAVAFYVGFKNNSAYARMWEARKIWGAIINSRRSWGMYVKSFVSDYFADKPVAEAEIYAIKKTLIYRHIGWIYALRSQLLTLTPWEHANQPGLMGRYAKRYIKNFGIGLLDDEVTRTELRQYLPEGEFERLIGYKNTATQIIDQQLVLSETFIDILVIKSLSKYFCSKYLLMSIL